MPVNARNVENAYTTVIGIVHLVRFQHLFCFNILIQLNIRECEYVCESEGLAAKAINLNRCLNSPSPLLSCDSSSYCMRFRICARVYVFCFCYRRIFLASCHFRLSSHVKLMRLSTDNANHVVFNGFDNITL